MGKSVSSTFTPALTSLDHFPREEKQRSKKTQIANPLFASSSAKTKMDGSSSDVEILPFKPASRPIASTSNTRSFAEDFYASAHGGKGFHSSDTGWEAVFAAKEDAAGALVRGERKGKGRVEIELSDDEDFAEPEEDEKDQEKMHKPLLVTFDRMGRISLNSVAQFRRGRRRTPRPRNPRRSQSTNSEESTTTTQSSHRIHFKGEIKIDKRTRIARRRNGEWDSAQSTQEGSS